MYKINRNSQIEKIEDGLVIEDSSSQDYLDYIDWYNQGNEPAPYSEERVTIFDTEDFLKRFTNEEQLSILNDGEVDENIKLILMKINTATKVNIDSSEVIDSIDYFVFKNLLTSERASEILS
jgi:hypothetical protein